MPTVSTRTPRRPSASRRLSGECASVTRQQRLSVPPAGLARWTREGVQLPALPAVYGELRVILLRAGLRDPELLGENTHVEVWKFRFGYT